MTATADVRRVLAAYPDDCQPTEIEDLGSAGGFSGAHFWRLASGRGTLCLRRWPPEHPTLARLQFIQAVLWHVRQEGFTLVPLPLETRSRAGYVEWEDRLWELTPWVSGEANYWMDPRPEKLEGAMRALAQFHRAAASFPLPEPRTTGSPGLLERLERLRQLQAGGLSRIAMALAPGDWPDLLPRARRLLELFPRARPLVEDRLAAAARQVVAVQPCLRDIWHDHVLFEGTRVTGFIDFGAMRPDHVAGDVARLLRSLVQDDTSAWLTGLKAYKQIRPLSDGEVQLLLTFDASSTLLSGLNWLEWIYVDRRRFDDRKAILARIDENIQRLAGLAEA